VKFTFNERAKSANERQETPSNKSCSKKMDSVIFRTIQQQRTNEVSIRVRFFVSTDVTQLFQQQALAFQTDRLGREVRSGFGSQ
jgi:hypothetical protein